MSKYGVFSGPYFPVSSGYLGSSWPWFSPIIKVATHVIDQPFLSKHDLWILYKYAGFLTVLHKKFKHGRNSTYLI